MVYTIEFQKRGLPHAHILLWIDRENKSFTVTDVDNVISAEIPDKENQPEMYKAVTDYMVHGPCGTLKPTSPCMNTEKKKCTKKFPKAFNERTTFDANGYPVYRRRDDGKTIEKNGVSIDNR